MFSEIQKKQQLDYKLKDFVEKTSMKINQISKFLCLHNFFLIFNIKFHFIKAILLPFIFIARVNIGFDSV